MKMLQHIPEECNVDVSELLSIVGPSKETRKSLRSLKPYECPRCDCKSSLHGHGWRCRSEVKKWYARWGQVWYWRLHCQACSACIMLLFQLNLPCLLYSPDVVAKVVVGRRSGKKASSFDPHPDTQRKWISRLLHWLPIVLSAGFLCHCINFWFESPERLKEAIRQCVNEGYLIYGPSRGYRGG